MILEQKGVQSPDGNLCFLDLADYFLSHVQEVFFSYWWAIVLVITKSWT